MAASRLSWSDDGYPLAHRQNLADSPRPAVPAASTIYPPPTTIKPQRILLLQLKRIGDFILTAPAIAALRAAHPQAEIVAIVPDSVASLAPCMPGLDRVLPYRAASLNMAIWTSLLFGEWDACYDFTGTDRSALMAWLSRARASYGYAKFASEGWRSRAYTTLCDASVRELHTVDFHLALVNSRNPNSRIPEFPNSRNPNASSQAFVIPVNRTNSDQGDSGIREFGIREFGNSDFAVFHIGTAREEKFWPAARWAEVIAHLVRERGLNVVLTGTNAGLERPHLDALRGVLGETGFTVERDAAASPQVLDLTGGLSLIQTAEVIARSAIAIGVDSMAMHLAAMLEKPQIVLYGPTNPAHWRPRHPRAVVLVAGQEKPATDFPPKAKGQPMELIPTSMVLDALSPLMGRVACF